MRPNILKRISAYFEPTTRAHYQDRRRAFLAEHIDVSRLRGLEFGGFDLPTVPPELWNCAIADLRCEIHLSKEFDIPLDQICAVDCIIQPGIPAYHQIGEKFDYVILCHVLEHVPDVITMLNDLTELLTPGGVLLIALPDKRHTLDASRDSTSMARLIERQLEHTNQPSLSEIADFSLAWNEGFREQYRESMRDFFHVMRSHQLFGDPDVHCNVWRDDEFIAQLRDLIHSDYVPNVELIGSLATEKPFNEFFVALQTSQDRDGGETGTSARTPNSRAVHYRTCNFCGYGQFDVWKRVHSPFPEQIYADSVPAPELGKELSLQYLTCRRCDLSSINPLPEFSIINRKQFDAGPVLDMSDEQLANLIADRENVARVLSDQFQFETFRSTGRLLDVSCGPGIGLAWLRDQRGWDVRGVEPAREFVEFANERFGVDVFHGLAQDLDEPDASFDIIMIDSSLQYMFDPLQTLISCHRLLRPGGLLFIHSPNRDSPATQCLDLNVQWGHWFFFTAEALHRIFAEIGFESDRIIAIQNPIDSRVLDALPDEEPVAIEAFNVTLEGAKEITEFFEDGERPRSDFFGIGAKKVEDLNELDSNERMTSLRAISSASRRQRYCVAINPNTDVVWPWEQIEPAAEESTEAEVS